MFSRISLVFHSTYLLSPYQENSGGDVTIISTRMFCAELLKKEKYFFENNAGEYSNPNDIEKKKLLVERVESIVSAEISKYFTIHQPPKQQENEKASQK